ncbi:MAG TPA: acyl-CoA dehydrogenase family protein, partial [Stellaceae bacterium]|nr:acyl-CoA dehydrogenase family protein [Stellaceae bacterium]
MDCRFTEDQNLLRDSVQKLMAKHCPPAEMRRIDRGKIYPYALYDAWVDAGLIAMPFAEAYGGLGGST